MSIKDDILTRVANIAAELAAMSSVTLGGLPNPLKSDAGTAIDHVGYRQSLVDELKSYCEMFGVKTIDELVAMADGEEKSFTVETQIEL